MKRESDKGFISLYPREPKDFKPIDEVRIPNEMAYLLVDIDRDRETINIAPVVSLHGAIATQARVNTDLGRQGLALLKSGFDLRTVLELLLGKDSERERRQVHGLTAEGGFAFTGSQCVPWCGHHQLRAISVAGNMLAGPQVLDAMIQAFELSAKDELSGGLLRALEAGQAAGGDKRGKQSAALLVASIEPWLYHNLRVDEHPDPVRELRRIYDSVVDHSQQIEREYGEEGLRLFGKVKY
jgi:uncharacterized Ntn-hydrolase superfamily protein